MRTWPCVSWNPLKRACEHTFLVRQKALDFYSLYCQVSEYLVSLWTRSLSPCSVDVVGSDFAQLYGIVSSVADLQFLGEEVHRSSRRAILRLVSLHETLTLLEKPIKNSTVLESLVVGIPKLLGRGYVEMGHQVERSTLKSDEELGCHYLSNLPSASGVLRQYLQQCVQ